MLHKISSEIALAIDPDRCGTVVLSSTYQQQECTPKWKQSASCQRSPTRRQVAR
ncbi:hypothetical protein Mapa_001865 [Marchantia paleacea]|nr:hypothetical protein Mapa_001865 [Marchantia paleacea]